MAAKPSSSDHHSPPALPSSPTDLAAVRLYVQSSPLFPQLGLEFENLTDTVVAKWGHHVEILCEFLTLKSSSLDATEADRVYRYYLPTYLWCVVQIELHREHKIEKIKISGSGQLVSGALVIGLTAPQGCGKTTLAAALSFCLAKNKFKVANLSIDDVYLTGKEQEKLATESHPNNALLKFRGNAGTHDVKLAVDTLKKLKNSDGNSGNVKIPLPRYDKTARNGRGDRASVDQWPVVNNPVDVVLFEGWMLGFTPVGADEEIKKIHADLKSVDERLRRDGYDEVHSLIDDWLVIKVDDFAWVKQWRLQQEQASRVAGYDTLTDEQVADFVQRFMPAYDLYARRMYTDGPWRGRDGDASEKHNSVFTVQIDWNRRVV